MKHTDYLKNERFVTEKKGNAKIHLSMNTLFNGISKPDKIQQVQPTDDDKIKLYAEYNKLYYPRSSEMTKSTSKSVANSTTNCIIRKSY